MKNLHFNNHISSKQDYNKLAKMLLDAIIGQGEREITLTVDDGDGDVWKYEMDISCERVENISTPITEN